MKYYNVKCKYKRKRRDWELHIYIENDSKL